MNFSAATYQNEYLAAGASEVHAVVTVTAQGEAAPVATEKAVVLIIDTSGSMSQPMEKIRSARRAAATALDLLPDGTWFAVIAGFDQAVCVYPNPSPWEQPHLVRADPTTRAQAIGTVRALQPGGGTAISTWLDLARYLFEPHAGAIRLAYLLTDGKNESESPDDLEAALFRCAGVFQCDARGVGVDWDVAELRLITSMLLGEVDIIQRPDEMDDDSARSSSAPSARRWRTSSSACGRRRGPPSGSSGRCHRPSRSSPRRGRASTR